VTAYVLCVALAIVVARLPRVLMSRMNSQHCSMAMNRLYPVAIFPDILVQACAGLESRLRRLEAQTRRQSERATIDTAEPLPITANEMSVYDWDRHDATIKSMKSDGIPTDSLSRGPRLARDVDAIADPGIPHPQKSTRLDKPTALCSSNDGFLRSLGSS
jgi:hypothetical protein